MVKLRVIVEGAVQGVGYRALVKVSAAQMGVHGLVRNLPDGRVEIFCDGPEEAVGLFLQGLDIKSGRKSPWIWMSGG